MKRQTGSLTLSSHFNFSQSPGLALWPCPDISSTPLASIGAGPARAAHPARSSSCPDHWVGTISPSSSSQSSYASLSGEASTIANILGQAAKLACLDPASVPTVYNTPTNNFCDSQLALTCLLAQLIAMVNDLAASVTFFTAEVENITSAQEVCSATPAPAATSSLEVSFKDLSSRVDTLSSHRATQAAHPVPQAPPLPTPTPPTKPSQQKKKLATSLTPRTISALDFPLLFEGKWYGNPYTNGKRHPDTPRAAILFASFHPQSEEAKLYSERYPATILFDTAPPSGFTLADPPQPHEATWAQVTITG